MIRKYLLPLLAVGGVVFAFWTVMTSSQPILAAPPVAPPSQAPFVSFVAGAGIIEASPENIAGGIIGGRKKPTGAGRERTGQARYQ